MGKKLKMKCRLSLRLGFWVQGLGPRISDFWSSGLGFGGQAWPTKLFDIMRLGTVHF